MAVTRLVPFPGAPSGTAQATRSARSAFAMGPKSSETSTAPCHSHRRSRRVRSRRADHLRPRRYRVRDRPDAKNAAALRKALDKYVANARKSAGPTAGRRGRLSIRRGRGTAGPDPNAVRLWAQENGLEISSRGRVPDHRPLPRRRRCLNRTLPAAHRPAGYERGSYAATPRHRVPDRSGLRQGCRVLRPTIAQLRPTPNDSDSSTDFLRSAADPIDQADGVVDQGFQAEADHQRGLQQQPQRQRPASGSRTSPGHRRAGARLRSPKVPPVAANLAASNTIIPMLRRHANTGPVNHPPHRWIED